MTDAPGATIALVGDLHTYWNDRDVGYFDASGHELVLVTGDLGDGTLKSELSVVRSLSALRCSTLVMPGNNDAKHAPELAAEMAHQRGIAKVLGSSAESSPRAVAAPTGPTRDGVGRVELCGYSVHRHRLGGLDVSVLAARPFAMGGSALSFATQIERLYGIGSLEESVERLRELVDGLETEHVVVLAHNGPSGLGDAPTDPWGRDFHPAAGDWGDDDTRAAVDHARARGHRVAAVVAGHMHLGVRGGGRRTWRVERDGVLYVNPALVPRIFVADGDLVHHHAVLTITEDGASVHEVLVRAGD